MATICHDITKLRPVVTGQATLVLQKIRENGLNFNIFETFRTPERQLELNQRNPKGSAPVGSSFHEYGLAFDVVGIDDNGNWTWNKPKSEWDKIGQIIEECGLVWGGRWKMGDCPHAQIKCGFVTIADCKKHLDFDSLGMLPIPLIQTNDEMSIARKFFTDNKIVLQEKEWSTTSPTWGDYAVTQKRMYDLILKNTK